MNTQWLKKMLGGYYNYTPPETFSGEKKPHYTDEKREASKSEISQGYYNITPPKNLRGDILPHHSREVLEDRTSNFPVIPQNVPPSPNNFLNSEQRMRYYLSQDLENIGKRVGEVKKPALLDLLKNIK